MFLDKKDPSFDICFVTIKRKTRIQEIFLNYFHFFVVACCYYSIVGSLFTLKFFCGTPRTLYCVIFLFCFCCCCCCCYSGCASHSTIKVTPKYSQFSGGFWFLGKKKTSCLPVFFFRSIFFFWFHPRRWRPAEYSEKSNHEEKREQMGNNIF